MKRVIVATFSALALACGGDEIGDSGAALNPAFGGTWNGVSVIAAAGYQPYSYDRSIVIAASGSTATVASVCPVGFDAISVSGSGNVGDWSGYFACPSVAFGGCLTTLTITSATARLNDNGTLTVEAAGSTSGCSTIRDVTYTFLGSR